MRSLADPFSAMSVGGTVTVRATVDPAAVDNDPGDFTRGLFVAASVTAEFAPGAIAFPSGPDGFAHEFQVEADGDALSISSRGLFDPDQHSDGETLFVSNLSLSVQFAATAFDVDTPPASPSISDVTSAFGVLSLTRYENLVIIPGGGKGGETSFTGDYSNRSMELGSLQLVSVETLHSEVPVPAARALLAGGLGAFGLLRRRRAVARG